MSAEARASFAWPLRLLVVASLVGPVLLLAYGTWNAYRHIQENSEERIERALDVIQEHALKAFQTVERTIAESNEVLRGLSDEEILAQEARLQARLKQTADALPQIEAITFFDRQGRPLVSSRLAPMPKDLNNSDRDYFQAQLADDAGTYIGQRIIGRTNGASYFVVSQRRPSEDGSFNGVVAVSVWPAHFREFYARMARGIADSFGLIRADGEFLARFPSRADGTPMQLTPSSGFIRALATHPEAGRYRVVSQIDGIERWIGYRQVPGYPIYVQVGLETAAMWRELRDTMLGHVVFGVPATLLLIGLSLYALRRTEGFYREVERRQRAEAALKQAQRLEALGRLTGGVAHDFNNLLMVIGGNVERLRRHSADGKGGRMLDAIATAVDRGATLTRHLLSFSRQQTHEPTAIELGRRLPELQEMLRSSLRGDIAVELDVADGTWPIKVDPSEFELAVLNIAVNARDAMPNGGRIRIAVRNAPAGAAPVELSGDFVEIAISDTGPGIPPEVLPRIFEPFFTTKAVGKGTGLGLSQVYGFARQSGGTATVASEPGRGARITLWLPRSTERPGATALRARAVPDGEGRILLVEDNAEVADVTRANLAELGYQVALAGDVESALRLLDAERFDLVVSDVIMPGELNGLDLAGILRDRRIPVLLVSGYANVGQGASPGPLSPILRKPYDVTTLGEAVREAMRRERLGEVA